MIAAYVAHYHDTRRELLATKRDQRGDTEQRSNELKQTIEKLVDLIVEGRAPDAVVERLRKLEAKRADLLEQLEALQPITVHPSSAEKYCRIKELRQHLDGLRDGQPATS